MSRALGRYELLRPIARGGMGEVYLARRRAAGVEKWLVVKRMRPERSGDTRFLDLFMREAKLSMSLAHQNIVPVFDFGRIDDQVFLAMERVEGKDLGSSLAKAAKGLPPMLAAFICAECLQALDYAHRRKGPDGALLGIVHRDVTPRNVLLSWSGEVKLTDFGIAVLAGDSPSRTAGTPAYMAPEQARGESLDVRADIYALGLVLREALLGERARRGSDRETVLEIARQGALDPWPEDFTSPLRAIVDKATSPDREARYRDARDMLEELDTFIVAERAASKTESPARQLATWLTQVWEDAREDEGALDAQIEAGVMVSFLDDGPLDVIGTGTQRSALATAADESTSKPSQKIILADDVSEPAPSPIAEAAPAPAPHAIAKKKPWSLRLLVELGIVFIVASIALVWWLTRRFDEAPRRALVPAVEDAAVVAEATADAATAVVPDPPPDAAVELAQVPPPIDAAVEEREVAERPRPRPTPPRPPPDAGAAASQVVAPAVARRKVTINSKPWSNWTVDGGAPHSGLDTVELTPGPHTIHFTGNPYFKADKRVTINVPDKDGFTYVETLQPAAAPAPAPPAP